ncbi:MAG: hypothetical protein KKE37_00665 [Verrucomicrobia bacterium]|nr:hypothetical protein [Verrucomicrobiota bacterium]MBU4289826.1 hypothetical protein [Verrucomicrobiota bacterium]MBU4427848.1 hypothetical protein [Verrucomicrobiota bacterium]MCG2679477.1 hypothetical protein [Kiritimatiellia bacterium]
MKLFRPWGRWVGGMLLSALMMTGCEDGGFKHDLPPGQGSIIVDNHSLDVIHVYIDGYYTNDVGDYDYEAYDRVPDVYRVVLDQKSGNRSYSHDVDVIEGKLTVLEVRINELSWEYDVRVDYE